MLSFSKFAILFLQISIVYSISYLEDVTLTSSQKVTLDAFKERVIHKLSQNYMKKEIYLVAWLRASDFNLNSAEANLLRNLEWRKENKIDTIIEEDWSDMKREFKYSLESRDKVGRSVLYMDLGDMELGKQIIFGNGERVVRYVEMVFEEACNLVRELGEKYGNITRGHFLINLDNYNIAEHGCLRCVPILLRIVLSYTNHWPECVDQVIGVNAPSTLQPLLNNILPLVNQVLKQNIHMYGRNKAMWMKELAKHFDLDQLPPALGGTKIYKEGDWNNEYEYNEKY